MRSQRASSKLAAAGLKDEAAAGEQPVAAAALGDNAASITDVAVRMSAVQSEMDKLKARHRCSDPVIIDQSMLVFLPVLCSARTLA